MDDARLAVAHDLDANGAISVEHDAGDDRTRMYAEVVSVSHRRQIGQRCAAAVDAHWHATDTFSVRMIQVGLLRETGGERGIEKPLLRLREGLIARARNSHRTISAMELVAEDQVRLQLPEIGQDLVETPQRAAPRVVILG